jgi:mannose-6-phosphate isomerase-like protein (cupin superfamily)
MDPINLHHKLSLFSEYWTPKIVGELNGQQVKLAKFQGAFVWHSHEQEDELFLVLKGSFVMEYRQRSVMVMQNEFVIVPRGVEHRPVAAEEVWVMLFEPATTVNTGDLRNERTHEQPERI